MSISSVSRLDIIVRLCRLCYSSKRKVCKCAIIWSVVGSFQNYEFPAVCGAEWGMMRAFASEQNFVICWKLAFEAARILKYFFVILGSISKKTHPRIPFSTSCPVMRRIFQTSSSSSEVVLDTERFVPTRFINVLKKYAAGVHIKWDKRKRIDDVLKKSLLSSSSSVGIYKKNISVTITSHSDSLGKPK